MRLCDDGSGALSWAMGTGSNKKQESHHTSQTETAFPATTADVGIFWVFTNCMKGICSWMYKCANPWCRKHQADKDKQAQGRNCHASDLPPPIHLTTLLWGLSETAEECPGKTVKSSTNVASYHDYVLVYFTSEFDNRATNSGTPFSHLPQLWALYKNNFAFTRNQPSFLKIELEYPNLKVGKVEQKWSHPYSQ